MEQIFSRSLKVYRDDGLISLFGSSKNIISKKIENKWLEYKYKLRHGDIAPQPDERLWVDPGNLEYTISSKYLYKKTDEFVSGVGKRYPNYGILGGSWDLQKSYWKDTPVWGGLIERYEEGKRWEDTTYYKFSIQRLKSNKYVGYLDGPQTIENFEKYLNQLDELYMDMRDNGYDPSSVITVHIGRNGEWMVGHGNHRRTLACIIGIESVPVRIKYRHKKWQNKRRRIYTAHSIDEISDIKDHLQHPDISDATLDDAGY